MSKELNLKAIEAGCNYINSLLQFQQKYFRIPGISVAISLKGEVLLDSSYGFANIEKQEPLTNQHLFRIASHSKMFTATAIMQLKEQGLLRLDDTVSSHLKWFKSKLDNNVKEITIRELLCHSSGIIRDGKKIDYWQLQGGFPTQAEFKQSIKNSRLIKPRFEQFRYSNIGYSALALLVEKIRSLSYEDYCQKHIIKPLKLNRTFSDFKFAKEYKHATGYGIDYHGDGKRSLVHANANALSGATGFSATAKDLCKFLSSLCFLKKNLLGDSSKREMFTRQYQIDNAGYGLGVQFFPIDNITYLGHAGGYPGFSTVSIFNPNSQLAISFLTNTNCSASNFVVGLIKTLHFYNNNYKTSKKFKRFEGRYYNIWGVNDIVNMGSNLVEGEPQLHFPFQSNTQLNYKQGTTFIRSSADAYDDCDAPIKFVESAGKVKYINWYQARLYPWDEFQKRICKAVAAI